MAASVLPLPGHIPVGKILAGEILSPEILSPGEMFDSIPIPDSLDVNIFRMYYFCSPEEYSELKKRHRKIFIESLSHIPEDKRRYIDFENSRFSKPNIVMSGENLRNEGLSVFIELSIPDSCHRIRLRLGDITEQVVIQTYNTKQGITSLQSIRKNFGEAIELLDQPFDEVIEELEKIYRAELEASRIEHDKETKKTKEKGFRMQYGKYLNNSSLTPISQIVAGVRNNKIPLGFSMNYQIEQILHQK